MKLSTGWGVRFGLRKGWRPLLWPSWVGLNPRALPNLAAWYDASVTASTTSDLLRIDGSNRVSLIADRSGNSGTNCLCLNGASGQRATQADAAVLRVSGDIDLRCEARLASWASGAIQVFLSKNTGAAGTYAYAFYITAAGTLTLAISTDGTALSLPAATANLTDTFTRRWVRVTRAAASGNTNFFTSTDGVTWSQLGSANVASTAGNIFAGTAELHFGAQGTGSVVNGNIFSCQVRSGIDGTIVSNPNFATFTKLASSGTESSANAATVTINSSGDLGARISGERDLVQLTAAKQPIYLPWSGTNYGWLPGIDQSFSTPDTNALDASTALEVVVRIHSTGYAGLTGTIVGKAGASGISGYAIDLNSGTPRLKVGDGATEYTHTATAAIQSVAASGEIWLKATYEANVAGSRRAMFYTSSDGVTFAQLGATVTVAAPITIAANTTLLYIGRANAGPGSFFTGRCLYASVATAIDGAPVAIFDPSRYTSGSTFTASTGETWTLNGGATIVTATSLYFDGTDDYIGAAAFSLSQPQSIYLVGQQVSWTAADTFFDGRNANTMALIQDDTGGGSPNLLAFSATATARNGGLGIGSTGLITTVFNGASSLLRVNRGTASTGNTGERSPGAQGVVLGIRGTLANAANLRANEFAVYAAAHDAATQDRFALYAGSKWRFAV